jgi:cytochrome d ubiquinol oxidase subunit II
VTELIGSASPLAVLLAAAIAVSLNAYVVSGGADFGGGVWDLFATKPRAREQRSLIEHAIGPIWEANHVWLILVVVLLFTAFPIAFARLSIVLHVPLTLMLLGIVARGSAFAFRSFETRGDERQHRWGRIFAIASLVTPFVLGICVGAIVSGQVRDVGNRTFVEAFVQPWLAPFPILVGVLATVLFAFLAAVYLTIDATDDALREDFRRRAILTQILLFVIALVVLVVGRRSAPRLAFALTEGRLAVFVQLITAAAAITALWSLLTRRFRLARTAAIAQVSAILWGWVVAQLPFLVPPDLTIGSVAAPPSTLRLVLYALIAGLVVLIPSLRYLFRVFKSGSVIPAPASRDEKVT